MFVVTTYFGYYAECINNNALVQTTKIKMNSITSKEQNNIPFNKQEGVDMNVSRIWWRLCVNSSIVCTINCSWCWSRWLWWRLWRLRLLTYFSFLMLKCVISILLRAMKAALLRNFHSLRGFLKLF